MKNHMRSVHALPMLVQSRTACKSTTRREENTHIEPRTELKMPFAFIHLSVLFVRRHNSSSRVIRSMSSCFLPDFVKFVLHCSLKLFKICLRRSTVLCLTLCRVVCSGLEAEGIRVCGPIKMRGTKRVTYLKVGPDVDGGHGRRRAGCLDTHDA